MNLQKMQSLIYRYGFDSGDPVTDVLNGAMHEIETEFDWPFLETFSDLVLAAGNSNLPFFSFFSKVIVLKDMDRLTKLEYYSLQKFYREIHDTLAVGASPEVYTVQSGGPATQIQVWPVPSVDVNLRLVYQGSTLDMVNPNDVPTIGGSLIWPTVMHMPIVFRAAAVLLQMENEEDRAKTAQDQYMSALRGCMARFGERELDEPDSVQDTQGYSSSGFALRSMR